jgi:hypothetical protein
MRSVLNFFLQTYKEKNVNTRTTFLKIAFTGGIRGLLIIESDYCNWQKGLYSSLKWPFYLRT